MSQEERDDLDWLKRAKDGSISQREAAMKMGVSDRWVRTLLKRMNQQGDAVVVHGLRGRPSELRSYRRDEQGQVVVQSDHLQNATRCLVVSGISCMRAVPVEQPAEFRYGDLSLDSLAWMR